MRAPASYASAKAYLADTLDWLNLWHNSAQLGSDPANSYNPNHNNNNYTGGFSP